MGKLVRDSDGLVRVTLALAIDQDPGSGKKDHDTPAVPPTEFILFREGVNHSEKGDFLWDDEARSLTMAKVKQWANRYPFDWGHGMLRDTHADPAEGQKAAGQFTPELRGKDLAAADINWTPLARQKIGDREWVYFSPAFNVDEDDRVIELVNCALTNLPAMHGIPPLVACSVVPYAAAPFVDAPWDGNAAVSRLRKWAGVDGEAPTDGQWKKYAKGFAIVRGKGDKLGDFALPHHDIAGGRFVTNIHGVDAARAALSGARGGVNDISPAERKSALAHLNKHRDAYDRQQQRESRAHSRRMEKMMTKEALSKAIHAMHEKMHGKMHDESARAALDEKLDEMSLDECKSYHDKLMGFMPKGDDDEGEDDKPASPPAKDKADKKRDAKADDDEPEEDDKREHSKMLLQRLAEQDVKIAALEAEKVSDKRSTILDRALTEKKITPAERLGKGDRGKFLSRLPIDDLREFLSFAKPIVGEEHTPDEQRTTGATGGEQRTYEVALSKAETPTKVSLGRYHLEVMSKLGVDAESLAKTVGLQARDKRHYSNRIAREAADQD